MYYTLFFILDPLENSAANLQKKINDSIKAVYHLKANHHDCAFDAIKVQKHLELKTDFGRPKRNYSKSDNDFWEYGKQELHARKRR
jgi:hypothetical protein